ncbi:MAG: DUF1365 domain-containing protein, partial [Planctomycetota bacterium]|nr:DUF1365 domain-containing protein [Planctomycetota bacterium]
MKSAMYEGQVYHSRHTPKRHTFRNRVCYLYLDLNELGEVFKGRWLWSIERWNLCRFARKDYLGDPDIPLEEAVRRCVEEKLSFRPKGAVRVLTQMRTWGFLFNPVSFYYCFDEAEALQAIVAEITNTPWGERHRYVLDARGSSGSETHEFRFEKAFHISPFFPMEQSYRWRFTTPDGALEVHMANLEEDSVVFQAGLKAHRKPITGGSLARSLLAFPMQTYWIPLGIYWHAVRLYMKRIPFYTHPKKRKASLPNP